MNTRRQTARVLAEEEPGLEKARQSAGASLHLDRLIHDRARLGIISALAAQSPMSFADLRTILEMTLYAFSSDNWKRPALEVRMLMEMFHLYLDRETEKCLREGIRLSVIGRRDRLAPRLLEAISRAETATVDQTGLWLRIAVDYSGRSAIFKTLAFCEREETLLGPDVDLLIRTGGERRLSDFLLWESAYAELHFTETYWPDFDAGDLTRALSDFKKRDRRFGGLSPACQPAFS